jgi:hypothetical protein
MDNGADIPHDDGPGISATGFDNKSEQTPDISREPPIDFEGDGHKFST